MPSGVENLDGNFFNDFNYFALSICHIFNLSLMNKQENLHFTLVILEKLFQSSKVLHDNNYITLLLITRTLISHHHIIMLATLLTEVTNKLIYFQLCKKQNSVEHNHYIGCDKLGVTNK